MTPSVSAGNPEGGEGVVDLMAALRESVDAAKRRRLQRDAVAARAVGDWNAERDALDALHVLDRGRTS